MKLRSTINLLFLCLATVLFVSNVFATKPNILFIYSDDQARDEFNFVEEGKLSDEARNLCPNMDQLCKEGIVFTKFYVSSSNCTPSRYSLLTGNYASRSLPIKAADDSIVRVAWNSKINGGDIHVGTMLKSAGYYTGFVGKNHTYNLKTRKIAADADPNDPAVKAELEFKQSELIRELKEIHGYDFAGAVYDGNPYSNRLPEALHFHNLDWVINSGAEFLDSAKQSGKPFYLHLATTIMHEPNDDGSAHLSDPLNTPIGYLDESIDIMPDRSTILPRVLAAGKDASQADVTWMDDGIGVLLDKLEALDLLDNTIILYFNDNGISPGKASIYEMGCRTFGFIWGYGAQGKRYNQYVQNVDLCPTIYELAGIDNSLWPEMDGKSIVQALNYHNVVKIRNSVYMEVGFTRAVVQDEMKYAVWREPLNKQGMGYYHHGKFIGGKPLEQASAAAYPAYFDIDQLYDVSAEDVTDIENVNLFGDPMYAEEQEILKKELQRYLCDLPGNYAELKSQEICASLEAPNLKNASQGTESFADNFRNNAPIILIRDNELRIVTHSVIDNITLVDMMGRMVYSGKSKEIDISGLENQIYILKVSSQGINHVKKIYIK